jgi:hypothetical protein
MAAMENTEILMGYVGSVSLKVRPEDFLQAVKSTKQAQKQAKIQKMVFFMGFFKGIMVFSLILYKVSHQYKMYQ